MKIAAAILAAAPMLAHAGLFAELGLAHPLDSCIRKSAPTSDWASACSDAPLGGVVLGWQANSGLLLQIEHWSSLADRDPGLNMLSIRYRWGQK